MMPKIMNETIFTSGVCTIPAPSTFLAPINTAMPEKINNHTIFTAHQIIFIPNMNPPSSCNSPGSLIIAIYLKFGNAL